MLPKNGSYTAPGLAETIEEFSDNALMIQNYSYYGAMNDDSISDYFLETTRQFQSTEPETYSPTFSPATQTFSSSPPSSPLCPLLPAVSKSSSKHRKSGRRKSSVGMLRSSNPFGFANYTPGDSQKILAVVAPSGSSKTKARREQEAHEKKRKLSPFIRRSRHNPTIPASFSFTFFPPSSSLSSRPVCGGTLCNNTTTNRRHN